MKKSGIKCLKCGHLNELGRVFCSSCGHRLDLSRVNTRVLAKSATPPRSGITRLIRFIVFVFLLAVVSLLLWPVSPVGEVGAPKDAKRFEQKLRGLASAQQSGLYVFEIVSESEVNAYLGEILKKNAEGTHSKGMRLGIDEINFQFTPDYFLVVMLAHWGPVQLSYEIKGRPEIVGRHFGIDLQSVRWGHLPLPGASADWMSSRLARVFSGMKRDREILARLGRCDLGHGRVRLVTRPARNAEQK